MDSPRSTGDEATVTKASGVGCLPRTRRILSRTAEVETSTSDIFDISLFKARRGRCDESEGKV